MGFTADVANENYSSSAAASTKTTAATATVPSPFDILSNGMTTTSKDDSGLKVSGGIKYEHLPDTQIRLLNFLPSTKDEDRIQCSLESFAIDTLPPYIALSYTWGSREETRTILVDGQAYEATTNLEDALRHLRLKKDIRFWVDAICINQQDHDEKKHQLRHMPSIFERAKETSVWLGREDNDSYRAISLINRMSEIHAESSVNNKFAAVPKVSVPGDEADFMALYHLLVRGYWFRVWVVQEIAVSRKVAIFCGACQIPWDSVVNATEFMLPHDRLRMIETAIHNYQQRHGMEMLSSRKQTPNTLRDGLQRVLSIQSVRNDKVVPCDPIERPADSLLYLLSSHRSTKATEAEDKYFALAGLCREDQSILDRTESTDSVLDAYILAAESTTKERGHSALDFLDFAGWPTERTDLPSWVPDWSYTRDRAMPLLYWQLAGQKHKQINILNAPGSFNGSIPNAFSFENKTSLLARGFEIDSINGLGFSRWLPKPGSEAGSPHNPEIRNPDESIQYGREKYIIGDEDVADAFWRTCVLNSQHEGLKAPKDWGDLFYTRPFDYTGLNPDHDLWYKQNEDFQLYGIPLKKIAQARRGQSNVRSLARGAEKQESTSQLLHAFDIAKSYRRLATTGKGHICFAPPTTCCGDLIVILFDCSVPVVLRREHEYDKHFQFIGTCYVHGIMQGDAMTGLSSQDSVEFEIR